MSVVDRIHIGWRNAIANYELTSDVAAEDAYPLSNMQNSNANEPTVFDMSADDAIQITWSSATEEIAGCFAIHNHNLLTTATVRLRLYAGESQTGTVVFDSTDTTIAHVIPWGAALAGEDPWGGAYEASSNLKTHFSLFFENCLFKSARLDISAPDTDSDMVSIDKIFIGPSYCPRLGQEWGWTSSIEDRSEHIRKPGGGMETIKREAVRKLLMDFADVYNVDRIVTRNILDRSQKSGDLLVSCDPNDVKGFKFEASSSYRRTSDINFAEAYYNGSSTMLSLEEN